MTLAPVRSWSVAREIAGGFLPLYLTMIVATASQLVDTAAVGRHATVSLAAFAIAMAFFVPAVTAASGVTRGAIPFAAAAPVERPDEVALVARAAVLLAAVVGSVAALPVLMVTVVGRFSGVSAAVSSQLGVFPALLAASVLVTSLGSSATSVLIGIRRGDWVLRAGITGTAVAVVLSPALVAGLGPLPRLGLPGAGVAMLVSSTLNASVARYALRRLGVRAQAHALDWHSTIGQALRIARVGLPLAGTVLVKFAGIGVLGVVAARLGASTAATYSILMSLANLLFVSAAAVGQALVPVLGRQFASDQAARTVRIVAVGVLVALGVFVPGAAVVALARDVLIPIFTSDPVVRAGVLARLWLLLFVVLTDAIQVVVGFGLIGIRRTMPSLVAFAICYPLLALIASPVASTAGLNGVFGALAAVNVLLALGQTWALRRGVAPQPVAQA